MEKIRECSSNSFPCFLTTLFFQRLKKMGHMHRTLCILKLVHPGFFFFFFLFICISELKEIRCLLHGLCERRCSAYLLHCISILLKNVKWKDYCTLKCLNVSESTRWYSFLMVFPFVLAFAALIYLSSVFGGWEVNVTGINNILKT